MNWMTYFIEILFSLALFVNALLFIPQAFKLFKSKNSRNISLITFAGFNLIQIVTVLHGYIRKDYILMVGAFLSVLTCGVVTLLAFAYRLRERNKE